MIYNTYTLRAEYLSVYFRLNIYSGAQNFMHRGLSRVMSSAAVVLEPPPRPLHPPLLV